jgi:hypothetical protein
MIKMNKKPFSCAFNDVHATANLFISIAFTLTCTHNSCMLHPQQRFFSSSSSLLLDSPISRDSLLNKDEDNNNQNSSSNASSAPVGDNSNNTLSEESNNNLPPQQVSDAQAVEDRNVEDDTNRSENEMDLDRPDDGDEMDVDP